MLQVTGQGEQQVWFDSGRTQPQKVLQVLIKTSANLLNVTFKEETHLNTPELKMQKSEVNISLPTTFLSPTHKETLQRARCLTRNF